MLYSITDKILLKMYLNRKKNKIPAFVCSEIGLVHSLGLAKIPVYSGSFFRDNPALYSRFTDKKFHFTTYEDDRYIEELCNFGKKLSSVPVLFSDDDRALLLISRNRERLQKYFRFMLPDHSMVEKLLDKRKFCHLCTKKELPAPLSFDISSNQELENVIENIPFPCIVKPAHKEDWWKPDFTEVVGSYKKAYKCDSPEEIRSFYKKLLKINNKVVIQEFVPGGDEQLYSINLFVDENGKIKGQFIAQKRRIYPITAGTGCYVVTVEDSNMLDMAKGVIQKLNLKGLLNIQFKRDTRTGKPRLMEIHVRNSFWSFLGTAAGVNLAKLYYEHLTNYKKNKSPNEKTIIPKSGVKFFDLEKDIKAFWQYRKAGEITFRDWIKSYCGDFVVGGHLFSDPIPTIMGPFFIFSRKLSARKYKA